MGVSPHFSVNPIIGAATFGDDAARESPIGLLPQRPSYLSRTIVISTFRCIDIRSRRRKKGEIKKDKDEGRRKRGGRGVAAKPQYCCAVSLPKAAQHGPTP
ncbi:hypothetical protein E2C01_085881 [Portunus trituberculatus]|uniref:Uncharacterized protein n=1 Tax=Portunus trituberculatus TaxID=210409 RepID=A0A5B7JBX4_PORTR|nr:hypothetical protein [Portunus trituberculatus]